MSPDQLTKCKIRKVKILTSSLSHNLFSFPIPTRPGDHPHPTGDFVSVSHSLTPDFVQSSPPLPVSHSPSLSKDPDSLPPFPSKFINHFPPDSQRSWRDEAKNWFSIPSFFFCLMVVIRDKKWFGYAVKFTVYLMWNLTLTPMLCLILFALVLQIQRSKEATKQRSIPISRIAGIL